MSNTGKVPNPIFRRIEQVPEEPFSGDLLQRAEVAKNINNYVERISDGAVICVDGEWGSGKSWFARNWCADLKKKGHQVIFIDAFAQDYIEDPFLLLASEFINQLPSSPGKPALKAAAKKVAKELIPISLKLSVAVSERIFLGTNVASEAMGEMARSAKGAVRDPLDLIVSRSIDQHVHKSKAIQEFRKRLSGFAQEEDKTVVVMVDELDRCKPDFAVRIVECVKHLFEVEKVLFVLFSNRRQLEESIRGVYGLDTGATSYLDKYIDLFFYLPWDDGFGNGRLGFSRRFLNGILKRYDFPVNYAEDDFARDMAEWAARFALSLRDLERATALFVLSGKRGRSSIFLSYLIALKIKKPHIFSGILLDQEDAYRRSLEFVMPYVDNGLPQPNYGFIPEENILAELHELRLGVRETLEDEVKSYVREWNFFGDSEQSQILNYFAKTLDLAVS